VLQSFNNKGSDVFANVPPTKMGAGAIKIDVFIAQFNFGEIVLRSSDKSLDFYFFRLNIRRIVEYSTNVVIYIRLLFDGIG